MTPRHFASLSAWRATMLAPRLTRTTSFTPVMSGCASATRQPSFLKTSSAPWQISRTSRSTGVTPRSPPHATRASLIRGARTARVNARVSTAYEIGARGSGPAMAASISAVSATVRAIGPWTLQGSHASGAGQTGTRPGEVRKPTTPQKAAGSRSEPPRSEPWASWPMPVARATAPPPVEPPQVSAGFHGLRVGPKTALKVLAPAPNSGVLVLPRTIAPAAFRRSTTTASSSGTRCSKIFEPSVVRMPFVDVRSLIDTGTPWSGPSEAPRRSAAVARLAASSACSAATVQ